MEENKGWTKRFDSSIRKRSFGAYDFEDSEHADFYNNGVKYNFKAESERILREMRGQNETV